MKRFQLVFVFLLASFWFPALAQQNWTGINQNRPVPADISLIGSNISETQIQVAVDGFFETAVRTHKGAASIVNTAEGVLITEKGAPDLGKLFTSIIVPDYDEMQLTVVSASYREFTGIEVAPSKGHFTRDINPEDVPFTWGEVYEKDAFWPGHLAELEDPFIMRDFRGQVVTIYPLQYNPVTRVLRVYTDMVIEVSTTGRPGTEPLTRTKDHIRIEPEFGQIYNRFFLNMDNAAKNYPILEGEEGSMLIIAFDSFVDAMQPFVNWKRMTGRKTVIVPKSQVGNTPAEIKTYVQNYYEEHADFAYLLLVGDAPQIPTMNLSSGHSDNGYTYLVGNDRYNDIFVGRFSAENVAHVETQVARMIHYERDINADDTWLNVGMGVARNEGAGGGHNGGEADYVHMNFIRDSLLNYTYEVVHQNYDGNVPGMTNVTAAQMSDHFNQGVSIVNFCNHGSTTGWSVANYSSTHVNQLTNINRLPFIWSVACVNGNFVNNYCFAEAWLRATHEGQPTGAIGTMMSTINQLWQPPMTGQDEMVTIMVEKRDHIKRTFGGLSINGSMKMIPSHGNPGADTHDTWVLFGDPSLMVRTDIPEPMMATYDPVLLIGTSEFSVTLPDADGAVVALSMYDEVEDEVIIVGRATVEGGIANVSFQEALAEPGLLTLVITGYNRITYINEDIQVIPPDGPYVIFDHLEIDDSQGNNNGQADYGEIITLNLALKNVGIEPAAGVQAVLSTENEHVTIIENIQAFGDIAEGSNQMQTAAYSFEVDYVIPDKHNVMFTLTITDNDEGAWSSNFMVRIHSSILEIGQFWVEDPEGDGNGRLDPGETADIMVRYTNSGGAPAMTPVSAFHISNPYITVEQSSFEHEMIPSGEYLEVAYTLTAHEAMVQGTFVDIMFEIEDAHLAVSEQTLIVGQTPDMTIGEGNTPSAQFPFYNYYKANRSQMLYLAEELGPGEKTITELAFEITRAATQYNNLPNFVIRMMHTDQTSMTGFVNTADAEAVFQAAAYQMPETTGWHVWEIEHFEYNGEQNLLVEIVWGLLPQWVSTFYQVASTPQSANMVAYGFSDTQAVPGLNGTSSVRPNIWFAFAAEEGGEIQDVEFTVSNQLGEMAEDAVVTIGSLGQHTDAEGKVHFSLMPGTFFYRVDAPGHRSLENMPFTVYDESVEIDVELMRVFEVLFVIDDNYGGMVDDAIIHIEDKTFEPGQYLVGDMEPGVYSFSVQREHYFDYSGEFELTSEDLVITITLEADGTQVGELAEDMMRLYPNPARDFIYVEIPRGETADIQLVNVLGEILQQHKSLSGTHSLSLNRLPAGQYFLRMVSEGKTLQSKSFTITR